MLIKNGLVLNACKNNAIEEILGFSMPVYRYYRRFDLELFGHNFYAKFWVFVCRFTGIIDGLTSSFCLMPSPAKIPLVAA